MLIFFLQDKLSPFKYRNTFTISQTTVGKKCKQLNNRTIPVDFRLVSKGSSAWYNQTKVFILFYVEKLLRTVGVWLCWAEGPWFLDPLLCQTMKEHASSSCSNSVKQEAGAIKL